MPCCMPAPRAVLESGHPWSGGRVQGNGNGKCSIGSPPLQRCPQPTPQLPSFKGEYCRSLYHLLVARTTKRRPALRLRRVGDKMFRRLCQIILATFDCPLATVSGVLGGFPGAGRIHAVAPFLVRCRPPEADSEVRTQGQSRCCPVVVIPR